MAQRGRPRKVRFIPTASKFTKRFKDGMIGGIAGGIPSVIATKITGSVGFGSIIGGIVGGAMLDETLGTIVVVNGVMDGVKSFGIIGN